MEFKTMRILREFNNPSLDFRVRAIVFAISGYTQHVFNKPTILTEIWRSDSEQDKIYGKNSGKPNIHKWWRAIDLRTMHLTLDEINDLILFLNHFIYTQRDGKKFPTVLYHEVKDSEGKLLGYHFHIQVDPDGITEIIK